MSEHEKLREAVAWAESEYPFNYDLPSKQRFIGLLAHAAKSTLPKTKMESFWHIEYSFREFDCLNWKPQLSAYPDTPEGRRERDSWIASFKGDKRVACIRVTGPHMQEVPA